MKGLVERTVIDEARGTMVKNGHCRLPFPPRISSDEYGIGSDLLPFIDSVATKRSNSRGLDPTGCNAERLGLAPKAAT